MNTTKVLSLSLLLFVSLHVLSQNDKSAQAKKILNAALQKQETASFKATTSTGEGKSLITQVIYQKSNPDGTIYKRIETQSRVGTNIYLSNNAGRFNIYGKTAVKSNFSPKDSMPDYDDYATFSLSEGNRGNIPCYIVTKTVKPDAVLYQRFLKSIPPDIKQQMTEPELKAMFSNTFTEIAIYYIGKKDGFNYSREYYSHNGKLKGKLVYNDIVFNPALDDKIFDVPDICNILIANNVSEFLANMNEVSSNEVKKRSAINKKP